MKQEVVLISLCFLSLGFSAPVEIKEESKRRESTRETLQLEDALKRLAGENKKFFPGPGLQPVPQVDGLEDHPEDDLVASLPGRPKEQASEEEETADEPFNTDESEGQVDDAEDTEPNEETDDNAEEDLFRLNQFHPGADEEEEVEEDTSNEEESLEQQEVAAANGEKEANAEPSDFDDVSSYLQQSSYGEQQQARGDGYGSMPYGQDYPAYGDIDGDGANEDYLVQDVMDMMEKHPELWARLLQARNMNLMEEREPQYEDLYDQVPLQHIPDRDEQMDNVQSLQGDSRYGMPVPNELYNDEETLRNMQQYEKLQDFYGDKTAHVVAKKQGGYGSVVDYRQTYPNQVFNQHSQEETEGSGENDTPHNKLVDQTIVEDEMREQMKADNKIPVFKVPMM